MKATNTQNTNLETLNASLEALKKRCLNTNNSDNKFAVQNKEYVMALLKSIA